MSFNAKWYICFLQETYFWLKDTQTEGKMIEKYILWKWKKAGALIPISDKTDFKPKGITRDKEGPSNFTSACLYKETQDTISEKVCISMFTAALFSIASIWKQYKYLIDEWVENR